MTTARDVMAGLIAAAVADLADPASLLLAVANEYGVTLSAAMSEDFPTERLHFRKGWRNDPPRGFCVLFEEMPTPQSFLLTGPIQQRIYTLLIQGVWRDKVDNKPTENPDGLDAFMSEMAEALCQVWDHSALAVNGAWTLPNGDAVLSPRIIEVDAQADTEEFRHAISHLFEITFTCFSLFS